MTSSPPEHPTSLSRRFAVEPFETTIKSKRLPNSTDRLAVNFQPHRRVLPQAQEISDKSSQRSLAAKAAHFTNDVALPHTPLPGSSPQGGRPPIVKLRRFLPQLIETTRRSKRRAITTSAASPMNEIYSSSEDRVHLSRSTKLNPPQRRPHTQKGNLDCIVDGISPGSEPRFSFLSLNRNRRHRTSFQVPHLPPILPSPKSEGTNDSKCPSLSTSPSGVSDEPESDIRVSRERESCDDRFSGYLLDLAARAAEKQLREQAMAAYPNEKIHEPVHHFALDPDSDSSSDEMGSQLLPHSPNVRKPLLEYETATVWSCEEVRLGHNLHEQQWSISGVPGPFHPTCKPPMKQPIEIGTSIFREPEVLMEGFASSEDAEEFNQAPGHMYMRSAASPAMLGKDLRFIMCISPKQTRFDTTQYPSTRPRGEFRSGQISGLWTPSGVNSRQNTRRGLWKGFCNVSDKNVLAIPQVPQTDLLTTPADLDSTCGATHVGAKLQLLVYPKYLDYCDIADVNGKLCLEQNMEAEFDDSFVTQIYNYLSLGYPALAWKYDSELSQISNIPLEDIRRDDQQSSVKGYIGVPEGSGCDNKEARDGRNARWEALRLYIRDWARQQTGLVNRGHGIDVSWGACARKGSWAI